jgi:hypothetical protein
MSALLLSKKNNNLDLTIPTKELCSGSNLTVEIRSSGELKGMRTSLNDVEQFCQTKSLNNLIKSH